MANKQNTKLFNRMHEGVFILKGKTGQKQEGRRRITPILFINKAADKMLGKFMKVET